MNLNADLDFRPINTKECVFMVPYSSVRIRIRNPASSVGFLHLAWLSHVLFSLSGARWTMTMRWGTGPLTSGPFWTSRRPHSTACTSSTACRYRQVFFLLCRVVHPEWFLQNQILDREQVKYDIIWVDLIGVQQFKKKVFHCFNFLSQ